jgi:GNAT superfamily N-acetyltransferase
VRLECPVATSFRCQKAANALDIDTTKKNVHELSIDADLETDFNLGLIVGASGSGKTTLAKQIFGDACFDCEIDECLPVIEQFPQSMSYDDCVNSLYGIGLTSVPCWIRPVATLSNGQRMRAIAALQMSRTPSFVLDEWTSVVDRTVAKAMSVCVSKFARKQGRRVVLLSCHYDVIDWLNPDWIIDCNRQEYIDRRSLWRDFKRPERLQFEVYAVDRSTWRFFSKYHYLSANLPGGHIETFGLFHRGNQIGFQCFANYVPYRIEHQKKQMHTNRTVIHPDYVGLGLGLQLVNLTSEMMHDRGFDVRAKFSSLPAKRGFDRYADKWQLTAILRNTPDAGGNMERIAGFRKHVKTYCYQWIGGGKNGK